MGKDKWADARSAPTLIKAHEAVAALRPSPYEENSAVWLDFYVHSAAVYREVAEVDRGHHHEAMYWATREQKAAETIRGGEQKVR